MTPALTARTMPRLLAELDPGFRPAALFHRAFDAAVAESSGSPVRIAIEQADGSINVFRTGALPAAHPDAAANVLNLERQVKFLLWSRGGHRVYVDAAADLVAALQRHYAETETGAFDRQIMGERIYERPFEILAAPGSDFPAERHFSVALGHHLEGCRIGFDLGASDRKAAAVVDGQVVFSEEIDWNPVPQADPHWHFGEIMDSLTRAAAHLPRVDAIGGSSAGVFVNNQVKVATLFRGVPPDVFQRRAKGIFLEVKRAWRDIPFEVVNDGEVTALAGSMALGDNAVLGIALGSSQAAGYVTPDGNITSWLNELAFAPIDYRPQAPIDEWSKDRGCGVQYFSQQAVGRLLPAAGITVPSDMPLPVQLKEVQRLMSAGDQRAAAIYRTLGAYLGYGVAHYARFYTLRHVLVLGRVTTGVGGDVMLETARQVLAAEFPDLAGAITLHMPDETSKRHGQAIAAASLPALTP
ncbi:MAG: ROK family protein [Acidobacteria bacterium]|nr:ROK family protein [Acidobacteriota bacterium]